LFEKLGIWAIYTPFWEGLPHCKIFHCFALDLLHQIHKGVLKDHLLKWCMSILGSAETDAQFRAMTASTRLRHFKHSISGISQWTGTEHKEMEKVFMGIIAGGVGREVLTTSQAMIDFTFFAQYQTHTMQMLECMEKCLERFHAHKKVFISEGIWEHFNIPKLHSLLHYIVTVESGSRA
jgi:hypothetical protein